MKQYNIWMTLMFIALMQFSEAFFQTESKKDKESLNALHAANVAIIKGVIREKAREILAQEREPKKIETAFDALIKSYPQYLGKWCEADVRLPSSFEIVARYLNPSYVEIPGLISSDRYCEVFFKDVVAE